MNMNYFSLNESLKYAAKLWIFHQTQDTNWMYHFISISNSWSGRRHDAFKQAAWKQQM